MSSETRTDLPDMSVQVALVCEQLRQIPELQGGYNAVGFSQGAPV